MCSATTVVDLVEHVVPLSVLPTTSLFNATELTGTMKHVVTDAISLVGSTSARDVKPVSGSPSSSAYQPHKVPSSTSSVVKQSEVPAVGAKKPRKRKSTPVVSLIED